MKRINYGPFVPVVERTDPQQRSDFMVKCRETLDLECYRPELLPVARTFEYDTWFTWYDNHDGYWFDADTDAWTDWPHTT